MKISINKHNAALFILLLFSASVAIGATMQEKYETAEINMAYATITFNSNSSTLTDAAKASILDAILQERAKGRIEQVTIAAWSDSDLPKVGQKLPDLEINLAKSRVEAISVFLKREIGIVSVAAYNMAESSHRLARLFKTPDSELKAAFKNKVYRAPVSEPAFQLIRIEGGAQKAVIVIQNNESI